MLDGAVEIFYKTEKIAAFDSKTTHTIGLYRTHAEEGRVPLWPNFYAYDSTPTRPPPDIIALLLT